jgi:CBS domain-containing protein
MSSNNATAVKDVMNKAPEFIAAQTTLRDAATRMANLDCGFLPIADRDNRKLQGVITDRDIVLRAVAKGMDVNETRAEDVKSDRVLYCFENDSVDDAAGLMGDQQVYRLVVLNNSTDKLLSGIVSLNDLNRNEQGKLAADTAKDISA